MIIKIKIFTYNEVKNYFIDTKNNICKYNLEEKELKVEDFEKRFTELMIFWPEKLKDRLPSTKMHKVEIYVEKGVAKQTFIFDGLMPKNYNKLINLLSEVEVC